MSATTGTRFGVSCRTGTAHRIKRLDPISATWLCGSESKYALLIKDPAEFGGVCGRCDARFFGRPMTADPPEAAPHSGDNRGRVYRCFSADGCLLYVGSCANWLIREQGHRKQTPWWPEVARVDMEPWPNLGAAKRAEIAAIRTEAPLYNKVHNVKRFRRDGRSFVPIAEAA